MCTGVFVMKRFNPRETRRMMQRMGMNMNQLEVEEAVFRTKDKEIRIEDPEVAIIEMQGQKIFQVTGGHVTETALEKKPSIPDEDVQLVAQQAKVTVDRARATLEETNGDLAQAILLLSQG
jgi:nascent polypeptide-associated complex subunit alpha